MMSRHGAQLFPDSAISRPICGRIIGESSPSRILFGAYSWNYMGPTTSPRRNLLTMFLALNLLEMGKWVQ